ncbi:MAG: penicillin-binding protein [Lachnospiraceae bacterium]|nr:penicillin-binding protein [Lachnospiraceae bacterium]
MEDERNINFSDEETSENPIETDAEKVLEAEETPEPEEAVSESEEAVTEAEETEFEESASEAEETEDEAESAEAESTDEEVEAESEEAASEAEEKEGEEMSTEAGSEEAIAAESDETEGEAESAQADADTSKTEEIQTAVENAQEKPKKSFGDTVNRILAFFGLNSAANKAAESTAEASELKAETSEEEPAEQIQDETALEAVEENAAETEETDAETTEEVTEDTPEEETEEETSAEENTETETTEAVEEESVEEEATAETTETTEEVTEESLEEQTEVEETSEEAETETTEESESEITEESELETLEEETSKEEPENEEIENEAEEEKTEETETETDNKAEEVTEEVTDTEQDLHASTEKAEEKPKKTFGSFLKGLFAGIGGASVAKKAAESTAEASELKAEASEEVPTEQVEETTPETVEEKIKETEEAEAEATEETEEVAEETTEEETVAEEETPAEETETEATEAETEEAVEETEVETTEAVEEEPVEETEAEVAEETEEVTEESSEEETVAEEETPGEEAETETTEAEDATTEEVEAEATEETEEITEETPEEEAVAEEETPAEETETEATEAAAETETAETETAEEVTEAVTDTEQDLQASTEKAEEKPKKTFGSFLKGLFAGAGGASVAKKAAETTVEASEQKETAPDEVTEEQTEAETTPETVEEKTADTEGAETEATEEETAEEPAQETAEEEDTAAAEEASEEETAEAEAEQTAGEETSEENAEETEAEMSEETEEVTEEASVEETETETTEGEAEESVEETETETTEGEAEESVEEADTESTETEEEASAEETETAESEEVTAEETETDTTEETETETSEAEETTAEEAESEATETEEVAEEKAEEAETEATEEKAEESETEITEETEETTEKASEEETAKVAAIAAPVLSAKAAKKQAKREKRQKKYAKYRAKLDAKEAKKKARPIGVKIVAGFFKTIGIILIVLASLAICAATFVAGVVYEVAKTAPEMEVKDVYPTMYPTTVLDADGNLIAKLTTDGSNRAELTAEEITEHVRWAVIDIEDERFYEHKGIDPKGIIRAVRVNLSSDRSEGASTITQQLIKNAVFEGGMEDTKQEQYLRKIREWKLALDLEKKLSKEEILTIYLNTINMGSGVYGIKQAARFYFNKELPDLTISECAVLAGITQNPSANNPFRHPETNRERQLRVLKKMLDHEHITQAEYDEAVADSAVYDRIAEVVNAKQGETVYSYFTDSLLEQVLDDFQKELGCTEEEAEKLLYAGGLTIHATQNPTVQAIVDQEMNDPNNFAYTVTSYSIIWNMSVQKADGETKNYDQNMLSAWHRETLGQTWYKMDYWSPDDANAAINEYKNAVLDEGDTILTESVLYPVQPQVSFSVMDYTNGQVLAVNGGRGEKTANLTLSRATDTFRQPGSTFKPLASFGPAIDMGRASLETPIVDEPFTYPYSGKQVRNWWGESYRGTATVREGIRNSMNVVAVKNLNRIGPENVIPYLQKMGFSTITMEDANLATALGGLTYGVSNLELCAAYAMIANNGVYIEPSFYTTIYNYDGSVLLERKPRTEQVFQEYTSLLLIQALQDVVNSGTGTGCAFWTAPLAGKTGTTNDNRDIWFAGFIPNGLCSCIWVGQDDNATLWNANLHQAIYSKTMYRIVEALGKQGGSFPYPSQEIKCICRDTGMLATENCPNTEIRFYDYGWGPGALCTAHPLTGNTEGTESSNTEEKTTKPKPTQTTTTTVAPEPETDPTLPPETDPTPPPETKPTESSSQQGGEGDQNPPANGG